QPSATDKKQGTTTTEPVQVTGTIIRTTTDEGAAASYQPGKTLVVREDSAKNPHRYVLNGRGHVLNNPGEIVETAIKPGPHARKEREERAAFVAVQAILTPAWMQSMTLVQAIAEGTTPSQIEADPRLFQAAQSIACILESLGYAVFARMVPLNVVDELLGGTVRVAWRKLHGYVEYERERSGSQKNWEWFQWLAEQIDRHSKARTSLSLGAHDAY